MAYEICYYCRRLVCHNLRCESPHCQETCTQVLTPGNLHYDFCKPCQDFMNGILRKTLREMQRKPKLRLEEGRE